MSADRFRTSFDTSFEASESETPFKLEYLPDSESPRTDYVMREESVQQQLTTTPSSPYYSARETEQQIMESPFREELLYGNSQGGENKDKGYQQQVYDTLQQNIQQEQQLEQGQHPVPDKELEFELLFASQDPEFQELLSELASEAEGNFVNFTRETGGSAAELEDALAYPDSESRIDQFFESRYSQFANQIETEIDRFSAYLSQNLREDMNYEDAERVIESYQVQPDQFFGRVEKFIKKVAKGVGTVAKKGVQLAKKIALGPIQALLNKIKPFIRTFLRHVISRGLRFVPEQYRTLAQKALDVIGLNREFESEVGATELLRSEVIGEYELEAEAHAVLHEGIVDEAEGESVEQEVYGTAELEREFDRELFALSETSFIPYASEVGGGPTIVSESLVFEQQVPSEIMGAEAAESEVNTIERARNDLISGISYEGADLKQLADRFIPAILPAVQLGVRLIGRDKVVNVIADLVAKLLGNIIKPPGLATTLSRVLANVGLKLMTPELPPEQASAAREQFGPVTVANIITETVDTVSRLPTTILEAEEEVLQSFVNEALVQSIANNVPTELLNPQLASMRKIPMDANWVPRAKGKYKVLSKKYAITLTPDLAGKIRTWRGGETLLDVLRNYQGWPGNPVNVVIRVFETGPGATLPMIARDYVGGTSKAHTRQIIPLTKMAATLLLNQPQLSTPRRIRKSMAGRRFYIVRLASPLPTTTKVEPIQRNSDAIVKFISPNALEARIYLNEPTVQRVRSTSSSRLVSELYMQLESLVVPIGSRIIGDILSRVKVPEVVRKEIISLLIGWVVKSLKRQLGDLAKSFTRVSTGTPGQGLTVIVTIELPRDFVLGITKINITNLAAFISKLISVTPSATIKILAGYKL